MARFKLIGAEIQGQDVNLSTPTVDEQRLDPRAAVVYETNDLKEAQAIVSAGGFYRNRDNFIAVSRMVDVQNTVSGTGSAGTRPQPFPQKG